MSLRPRTLVAALACLPFYVLSSLMPARAAAGHTGLPGRAALVRQASEDLATPAGGPVIYVSNATGNDANDGSSLSKAKRTIQAGIIATSPTSPTNSGTVLVEPGTYTGTGNFNIDFGALAAGGGLNPGTRNITVMSDGANGGTPANTLINIAATNANQRRGFTFVRAESAAAQIIGFTIENGNQDSGNGGAIGLGVGAGPTIQNCVFVNNEAALGGAIESAGGSPIISECTFTNNKAVPDPGGFNPGGAIEFLTTDNTAYTPVITNCVFSGNSAPTDGAAIDISGDGNGLSPKITNCTFTQNTSVSTGPGTGGTIGVFSATPIITNCILYNDTVAGAGEIVLITLPNTTNAIITASHDDVQGGYPGAGNISLNPNFATGLDLAAGSPAINAGTTSVPLGVNITIDRTLRGRDIQPDLGAYEVLAPTANAQSVAVPFNTAKGVTLTGSDPNVTARALTFAVTSAPAHGTVSGTAPNLTYTPTAGYSGPDSFTFKVDNGTYTSPQVMVTLTVAAGVPAANAQSVTTGQNTAVNITLTGSDPDVPALTLTYTVTSGPAHGTLTGNAPNLTYTPTAGYFGPDSFTFRASNGTNISSTATVSITVIGTPTANNQSVAVPFNTGTAVTLTGSDPNTPARSLTFTVTSSPAHGTLTGTAPNLTYTPTTGYHGADSFTFVSGNGVNLSPPATVSLSVAVGTPTANAQSVPVAFNTATAVTLTGTDPDVPALPLTFAVTTGPAHGTLTGTGSSRTYTPNAGYAGPDTFQFTVSNGVNTSSAATVSLTVNPVFLVSLTFLTPVEGGTIPNGTVTLSGITPTDVVVGLSSTDSAVIRVHRSVIVPAGSSSATFPINTYRSHVTKTVTLTATLAPVTLTKDLTITGR